MSFTTTAPAKQRFVVSFPDKTGELYVLEVTDAGNRYQVFNLATRQSLKHDRASYGLKKITVHSSKN